MREGVFLPSRSLAVSSLLLTPTPTARRVSCWLSLPSRVSTVAVALALYRLCPNPSLPFCFSLTSLSRSFSPVSTLLFSLPYPPHTHLLPYVMLAHHPFLSDTGMSGADIAAVCNEAALHAARVRKTRIDAADFEHAVDRVLMGLERRSRVVSKDERHIVSVHEVGHALTSWFLKTADPVLKVSIIPRGEAGLGFTQSLPSTDLLQTQEALLDRMVVLLGGRAAEQIMFGRITTGAQDDLRKVTELAYALITRYGMSSSVRAWNGCARP